MSDDKANHSEQPNMTEELDAITNVDLAIANVQNMWDMAAAIQDDNDRLAMENAINETVLLLGAVKQDVVILQRERSRANSEGREQGEASATMSMAELPTSSPSSNMSNAAAAYRNKVLSGADLSDGLYGDEPRYDPNEQPQGRYDDEPPPSVHDQPQGRYADEPRPAKVDPERLRSDFMNSMRENMRDQPSAKSIEGKIDSGMDR